MSTRRALTVLVLLPGILLTDVLLSVVPAQAQLAPPLLVAAPPANLSQGREALTDKHYADATKFLAQAANEKTGADEALLLLGNAHLYAKEYSEAIAAYQKLATNFPNSSWRRKAAFQTADAFASQKNWKAAANIYAPELEYLTSPSRREQVASTYLKYADEYFAPGEKASDDADAVTQNTAKQKLLRAKALYLKAVEIGLSPTRHAEVLLRAALSDFYAKNYSAAIPAFQNVVTQYPQSDAAATAQYFIGLSYLKSDNGPAARRALRDFLFDHPDHEKRGDAYFAIAQTWRVPAPSNDKELSLGVAALKEFLEKFPAHSKALQAEYWIGLSHFNRGHLDDAIREWQALIARHPRGDEEEIALAKYNMGAAYLKQKKFEQAISAWENFLAQHPVHRLWNDAQRKLIDAHYLIGEEAYKAKNYEAALAAWENFSAQYPLDFRNADIMFRLGVMLDEADKRDEALAQWRKVVSKYGGTEAASRAQYMIALALEKQGKWDDAFAALKLVEGKWKTEAQARLSTLKTRRLAVFSERAFTSRETPKLKLVTRGVPRVLLRAYRVDLRDFFAKKNTISGVDKLDLNLIAPDKEWTQEIQAQEKEYSPYREIETQVKMPFEGGGVWAVVCRALEEKTDEPRALASGLDVSTDNATTLEATSVVFITDLGIITKATKNDVLVWAENLVTQQPVAGAEVFLSDGEKIIARGITDENGAWHYEKSAPLAGSEMKPGVEKNQITAKNAKGAKKEKKQDKKVKGKVREVSTPAAATSTSDESKPNEFPTGALRVLAVSGSQFAATENDLGRVAQVAGLSPTGLLYSDRPLYRAGQKVQLRGVVRQVKNGVYAFAAGAEYSLVVSSPSGTTIFSRRVKLSDWGTFNDALQLPEEAAPGWYRMRLSRAAKTESGEVQQPFSAGGAFQVAAYQLDKVRLQIELPKNVFLRGEEIKGSVSAQYFSGEALRKRKIRFGWNNSVGKEYETNEMGKFEFTIPTRDFDEDQTIRLWARFEDEGASAQNNIFVASVGASASLSTVRSVFLAGEEFAVKIVARDLAGKPVAGNWTLRALKIEKTEDYGSGEREAATQNVKTDADGDIAAKLTLKEAGDYILRLEGKDQNNNPVISEIAVVISGADDDVRLRVFADSETLKSGADAKLRVFWRGGKAGEKAVATASDRLALVTYEADRVLGKQLVRLAPGENVVSIPVSTRLAPLFRCSIALLDGDDLHQATKWFVVERNLQINVQAVRENGATSKDAKLENIKFTPGEKVRVQITSRDQSGKPVAAEFSLAAIDAALWQRAQNSGSTPPPIAALWGARYATDNPVLTTASNTFNFAGEARQKVLAVRQAENFSRAMLADSAEYPDVPLDHWSYNAMNRLSQAGIIEGYPNGTYSGGRAMTRYEMAVGIARVLQNAQSGNKPLSTRPELNSAIRALASEYTPELAALGVRTDDLENRATALENRVVKPPRMAWSASQLHRTGAANYNNQQQYFIGGSDTVRDHDANEQFSGQSGNGEKTFFSIGSEFGGVAGSQDDPWTAENGALIAATGSGFYLRESNAQADLELRFSDRRNGDDNEAIRTANAQNLFRIGQAEPLDAPRADFDETAFWNPHVVTDENGEATVEFSLPDALTQWRIEARGVSKDSLAGEGESQITASKDFWIELQTPPLLQAGDTSTLVAVLHNNSESAVTTNVQLSSTFDGGKASTQTQSVSVPAKDSEQASFEIAVPEALEAKLQIAADGQNNVRDGESKTVPIRPFGIERTVSKSGIAQDDRDVEINLPDGEYSTRRLQITVTPPAPSALFDALEKPQSYMARAPLASSSALRLLALARAAQYLKITNSDAPRFERFSREIEGLVEQLSSAQNNDGGWSWAFSRQSNSASTPRAPRRNNANGNGNGNNNNGNNNNREEKPSDLLTSAEATAALAFARELGFEGAASALDDANGFLNAQFSDANDENKTLIVWAQSVAGVADFAHANRLYRGRNSLSTAALARLVLILKNMAREEMAREVLDLLLSRTSENALRIATEKPAETIGENVLDVNEASEIALVAWATAEANPANSLLSPLSQLLWSKRIGNAWSTPRATSYAVCALLKTFETKQRAPEKYALAISVDGQKIKTLNVDSDAAQTTIEIPIPNSRAKVAFDLDGRGTYTYSVVMNGFTKDGLIDDAAFAALQAKGEDASATLRNTTLKLSRKYYPSARLWNGREVPAGYSVVSGANGIENVANEVRIGERVRTNLYWTTNNFEKNETGATLVLREPLPAGARIIEESLSGDYDRYEISDRAITFYFRADGSGSASYLLSGAQPGNYRVPPAKIWSWEKPGLYAISTFKNFRVLPRGAAGTDKYQETPDEIFNIGKWSFERASEFIARGETPEAVDVATAEKNLGELFKRDADPKDWKLTESAGREVSRMLFSLALRKDDAAGTVKFFEALRERYPDLIIPFAEIVQTAKAYGKIGEVEREVQVLKATAEASFRRETGVAGTLVEEGEHRAAYDFLAKQAQQYPDLENVQSAMYTLAQSIAGRASALRKEGESSNDDQKKKQAEELNRLAASTLRDFLALYPDHALADEASFAYAANLTEQGKFADAVTWANRSRARYAESTFGDDYDYIAAYASFLGERYDDALKLAQQLATTEYPQIGGEKKLSAYRPFALYIAAQIHHARGEIAPALEYYRQVAQQFPDAREAADSFDQKSLKMPEVVSAKGNEPLLLKVTSRNVEKATIAVYKVDLLRFYQERKSLLDLGQMNLAGIAPAWQGAIEFGKTQFADVEKTVTLPLPDGGAYFVTVQAEGARPSVSGVVVRSSLQLEVQEDATSGRVRVNVARAERVSGKDEKGKPNTAVTSVVAPKAEVWAVGSEGGEFRKGTTDLRGLVALDDLRGRVTVIARQNGEYAFYRGERILQPQLVRPAVVTSTPPVRLDIGKADFKNQARDAYMTNQTEITKRNDQALQGAMQGGKGAYGVSVGKAF